MESLGPPPSPDNALGEFTSFGVSRNLQSSRFAPGDPNSDPWLDLVPPIGEVVLRLCEIRGVWGLLAEPLRPRVEHGLDLDNLPRFAFLVCLLVESVPCGLLVVGPFCEGSLAERGVV